MMDRQYKVIGAYDSETTNIVKDGEHIAFPTLHQLGLLTCPITDITPDNVESHTEIELYRHTPELYERLDAICNEQRDYVPVILCHNLSFDMYGLSSWLNNYDVKVLAKSPRKPITFTVLDDNGNPSLVIWDTLIFSQQSLYRMGLDCGYSKAKGEWNYNLIRTSSTLLSDAELDYAKRDIYALLCWLSWWLRCNPDITPEKLGLNVVTKTGVVRERRKNRFSNLRNKGYKHNVGKYWFYRCKYQAPKTDDELFTMLACTRGGFAFCASKHASIPYDLPDGMSVIGYDATSQHPAQIVSRYYPIDFHKSSPKVLNLAFQVVCNVSINRILKAHDKPFPAAFNACFRFCNLRPKLDTLFSREGIFPLASARYKKISDVQIEENGDLPAQVENMKVNGYVDTGIGVKTAFGKIISARELTVWITELTAWEMQQCYVWDSAEAISGYYTGRFTRPNDIDIISIMQFYKAKNAFKSAIEEYEHTAKITNAAELKALNISPSIIEEMESGKASETDVKAVYQGLKADLNAIFGISATNSYRRKTVLTTDGIGYEGEFGICNAPKTNKVWYQFGQRIVGWSRIAQIVIMNLVYPYVKGIINGDTDSIKLLVDDANIAQIETALKRYSNALDRAKNLVCTRVKVAYPKYYDSLDGIGHYVSEFQVKRYCASWNKAYLMHNANGYHMTVAGLPSKEIEQFANSQNMTYEDICNKLLGYNVTYVHDITGLNARKFPQWGDMVFETVTDYKGNTAKVAEPKALALYPMSKTINDTGNSENAVNMRYAIRNNPNVNIEPMLVCKDGFINISELI